MIKDIRLTEAEIDNAWPDQFQYDKLTAENLEKEIMRGAISVANTATDKAIKKMVEWIEKHSILERCDPDTTAYFIDYLAVDYPDWQALKDLL